MPAPVQSRPSPSPSPQRSSQPLAQIEILYNIAVQSFVRRDHAKTLSTLARLLDMVAKRPSAKLPWYDLTYQRSPEEREGDEWRAKVLKLVISSYVSLYTDPPAAGKLPGLLDEIRDLLPPALPDKLLSHVKGICESTASGGIVGTILPPSLVSTLLLASLKLTPSSPALDFAHTLAEEWLTNLPDDFMRAIAPQSNRGDLGADRLKRLESAREGYLKVVELFVGEVLVKEGEWDMARSFLDGEGVMTSRRKENLFRHIRAAQSRPRSNPASPASSGILPSPSSSTVLPAKRAQSSRNRSSSSSATSSSSEATARPNANGASPTAGLAVPKSRGRANGKGTNAVAKGKSRAGEDERPDHARDESVSTKSSLPSRLFVNHSPAGSTKDYPRSGPSRPPRSPVSHPSHASWDSLLALLPLPFRARLQPILSNPWLLAALSIPLPLATLIIAIMAIRRRLARFRSLKDSPPALISAMAATGQATLAGAGSSTAARALEDVRQRLRRARERGFLDWIRTWLMWWVRKLIGVWRMGTTITYL